MQYTNTFHSQFDHHHPHTQEMESVDLCEEYANSLLPGVGETDHDPTDIGDLNSLYNDISGDDQQEAVAGPSHPHTQETESVDPCEEYANSLLPGVGETDHDPTDIGDLNSLYNDISGDDQQEAVAGPSNRQNLHELLRNSLPQRMVSCKLGFLSK